MVERSLVRALEQQSHPSRAPDWFSKACPRCVLCPGAPVPPAPACATWTLMAAARSIHVPARAWPCACLAPGVTRQSHCVPHVGWGLVHSLSIEKLTSDHDCPQNYLADVICNTTLQALAYTLCCAKLQCLYFAVFYTNDTVFLCVKSPRFSVSLAVSCQILDSRFVPTLHTCNGRVAKHSYGTQLLR